MMYVVDVRDARGGRIYTRGGIADQQAATDEARRKAAGLRGSWTVIYTTVRAYRYWTDGDHSGPIPGRVVAQGRAQAAA